MEIDYKIEREILNLEECGLDKYSSKYKQIEKKIQVLKRSREEVERNDGIELIRSRSNSSSSEEDKEDDIYK